MESIKPKVVHPRLKRAQAIVKLVDALGELGWTYKREAVVTAQGLVVGTPEYIKQWEKTRVCEQNSARERGQTDVGQVQDTVRCPVFDSTDS